MTRQKPGCLNYAFLPLVLLTFFSFVSFGFSQENDCKKKVEEKLRNLKFKVLERQARLEAENENLDKENQRLSRELSEALKKGGRARKDAARKDKLLKKDKLKKLTDEIEILQNSLLAKNSEILQLNALVKQQEEEILELKNAKKEPPQGLEGEIAQLTAEVIIGKNSLKERYR